MFILTLFFDTYNDAQNSWPTAALIYQRYNYQVNLKLESAYKDWRCSSSFPLTVSQPTIALKTIHLNFKNYAFRENRQKRNNPSRITLSNNPDKMVFIEKIYDEFEGNHSKLGLHYLNSERIQYVFT